MGVSHLRPPSATASRMETLRQLWSGAGIEAIETREISVGRTFKDFDDFWTTSALGSSVGPTLASMPAGDAEVLKSRVRARLPAELGRAHHLCCSRECHQRSHAWLSETKASAGQVL